MEWELEMSVVGLVSMLTDAGPEGGVGTSIHSTMSS